MIKHENFTKEGANNEEVANFQNTRRRDKLLGQAFDIGILSWLAIFGDHKRQNACNYHKACQDVKRRCVPKGKLQIADIHRRP